MYVKDIFGKEKIILGLDFETYYEKGKDASYTLSKMTTTTYVRDPRFKAHGAAIFGKDEVTRWISYKDLPKYFRKIDWPNTALLCHNTAFDGFILSQVYGHVPGYYLDTLSMSRGEFGVHVPHSLGQVGIRLDLGDKIQGSLESVANVRDLTPEQEAHLAEYAVRDVDLMMDIFRTLYQKSYYPEKELHIIDLTMRAFCDPKLRVDHDLCRLEAFEEAQKKTKLVQVAGVTTEDLMSNPKFATLLRQRGVEPPTKISLRTGEETFAFAKSDLDFQALEDDPRVADLLRARKAVKSTIAESRAVRLIEHSNPTLPVPLIYCGAHTHRWSAGDKINLQNLPAKRKGQSGRLREAIMAPEGQVLVVVDSSQIEARTTAWAAGQQDLVEAFAEGKDIYSEMASTLFGYPVNKHDNPDERQLGKICILGLGYGMGWAKFAQTVRSGAMGKPINIDDDFAQKAVQIYRNKFTKITKLWRDLDIALTKMLAGLEFELGPWKFYGNRILMPNDLFIHYPSLTADEGDHGLENFRYKSRNGETYIYGGKLTENLIQSTTRTIVAVQALKIAERYPIVSLVHDEVLYLAPEQEADHALEFGLAALSTPPDFVPDLPCAAEGGYGPRYTK